MGLISLTSTCKDRVKLNATFTQECFYNIIQHNHVHRTESEHIPMEVDW